MSKIIQPGKSGNGNDLSKILGNLIQNDLYFETTIYAVVEILKETKGADGLPLITVDKLAAKAEECVKRMHAEHEAPKPLGNLILPK